MSWFDRVAGALTGAEPDRDVPEAPHDEADAERELDPSWQPVKSELRDVSPAAQRERLGKRASVCARARVRKRKRARDRRKQREEGKALLDEPKQEAPSTSQSKGRPSQGRSRSVSHRRCQREGMADEGRKMEKRKDKGRQGQHKQNRQKEGTTGEGQTWRIDRIRRASRSCCLRSAFSAASTTTRAERNERERVVTQLFLPFPPPPGRAITAARILLLAHRTQRPAR